VQVFLSGLLTTIGQFLLFPVPFSFKFVVFLLDLSFQSFRRLMVILGEIGIEMTPL